MDYYSGKKEIQVACKGPQGGSRSDQSVIAKWWEDFQEVLVPPLESAYAQAAPLKECWLPDPETEKAIGPFLAAIDLDSFGEDRNTVEQWFRRTLDLRTHLGQVTGPEWTTILGEFLPRLIEKSGTSNESLRVARACYEAALTSIEGEDLPDKLSIPLLCGRGDESRLVPPGEPRWIADDAECAEIFKDVVWVFSIPEQCYPGAKERLGVKSLKGSVQREQLYDPGEAKEDHKLSHIYQDATPFVFAWRRHRPSGKIERLRELLAGLQVKTLPSMDVRLTLPEIGVTREHQERFKGGVGKVFLREDTAGVPMLAKAIAEALGLSRESANLLENLLRCGDDTARKDKLVSENIPGNEIDR